MFFSILFYIRYIYIVKDKIIVDSDNLFNTTIYENDTDFSGYLNLSTVKTIAFYSPILQSINKKDNSNSTNNTVINEWEFVKSAKSLYKGHHQPRKPLKKKFYLGYYDTTDVQTIKKQIKLAKNHGIYGFGIYFYWFNGKILFQKTLNIFLENEKINFPFFLIWKNENYEIKANVSVDGITVEQEYKEDYPEKLINSIKRFMISEKYIKINDKPVFAIYNPLDLNDLKDIIQRLREHAREIEIGEIYILAALTKPKNDDIYLFDAAYEFPPKHFFRYKLMQKRDFYYYSGLIYRR